MSKNCKDVRTRNWTFLIYPDSCTYETMLNVLNDLHVAFALSPLHDRDYNPDGTPKKPHYHLELLFDGNKSLPQIQEISNKFSGVLPFPIQSVRQMTRYLIHKDNPEKAQYLIDDVLSCGVDLNDLMAKTGSEFRSDFKSIIQFIRDHDITEFSDLIEIIIDNDYDDWLETVTSRFTVAIKEYISSRRFKRLSQISSNQPLRTDNL